MEFILITGPPAVGKMTVGQELAKKLGYKLFYNHLSLDIANRFFEYGDAEFKAINEGIRTLVFKTCAESKSLKGLIFTLVWAFDHEDDWAYVAKLKTLFVEQGWNFNVVELTASQRTRLARNGTPNRLAHKPFKQDIKASNEGLVKFDKEYQLNSTPDQLVDKNHLLIDNDKLSPMQVADRVIKYFQYSQ